MSLNQQQNHSHTGLAGDGNRIRYQDLIGVPKTTPSGSNYEFRVINHFSGTGDITISGIGFTPTRAAITVTFSDSSGASTCHGRIKGTTVGCILNAGAGNNSSSTVYPVIVTNGSGTVIKRFSGVLTSDGIILTQLVSSGTVCFLIELFS